MAEEAALSPRKTALVLALVAGCFAVLWPRLLRPALLGPAHDALRPNQYDRAAGCCDVIFETDVNAIKIMTELCGNILERKSGPLDARTAAAFASGKLPLDIIAMCRIEVNATCGVDISSFLQQNVKLGKSYKQILDEVRSYNSSACLKMHFGVPTWQLGAHVMPKMWTAQEEVDNAIKQERPPHLRGPAPHPAMRERGRAIPPGAPTPPSRGPVPIVPTRNPPKTVAGRVGQSPLSVYYQEEQEPPPIPGMRPPLGGAGGVLPPPKSSVGFVMPIYTICIVIFFMYTLCKILFKRTGGPSSTYESVDSDPHFRRHVFEDGRSSRTSPESKLVVTAISGLVAEVQQQMEASYAQSQRANGAQDSQNETTRVYTNGTLRSARDTSSVPIITNEFTEITPETETTSNHKELTPEEQTPESKERTPEYKENTPEEKEWTPELEEKKSESKEWSPEPKEKTTEANERDFKLKERSPESKDTTPELNDENMEEKQSTPELLAEALKEESPQKEEAPYNQNEKGRDGEDKDDEIEGLSEEEIEYEEEEEEEEESPVVRQLRASVEKDKASVKVLGMEMTAHCEGGAVWGDRPLSPTAHPRPPVPLTPRQPQRPPHEADEVSSIYLEGDIPHQSRLLVADSATRTDQTNEGKNSPVVLSGKMTLSLINDLAEESPERDLESTANEEDDFTTASAVTQPKLNTQQEEELSEEEVEEEVEEEEEEMEVEEIELEDDEEFEAQPQALLLEHTRATEPPMEHSSDTEQTPEYTPEPLQEQTSTLEPFLEYTSTLEPPPEQTSTPEPSLEQSSSLEPPPDQTSIPEPSLEHSSSLEPPLEQTSTPELSLEQSSSLEPLPEQTSTPELSLEQTNSREPLPEYTSTAEYTSSIESPSEQTSSTASLLEDTSTSTATPPSEHTSATKPPPKH